MAEAGAEDSAEEAVDLADVEAAVDSAEAADGAVRGPQRQSCVHRQSPAQ